MEKERLFKMTEIEQNMLVKALSDVRGWSDEIPLLLRRVLAAPNRRLYLNDSEHRWVRHALNELRNAYLAAGRYSDGIDTVILRLMKTRYRRAPGRED